MQTLFKGNLLIDEDVNVTVYLLVGDFTRGLRDKVGSLVGCFEAKLNSLF